LVGYSLPSITGFAKLTANLPAVIENKGFELELASTNVNTDKFNWSSNFNISFPRNKLKSYPNIKASAYANSYVVGMPLDILFVYKYKGIDAARGEYTFEDLNSDGVISAQLDRLPIFTGQKYFGGINNTFSYKNIDLDIFASFVKQNVRGFIANNLPGAFLHTGANQPTSVLDRWRKPGDAARYQRFNQDYSLDEANFRFRESTEVIADASFIRLKNVVLSWRASEQWSKSLKIEILRIYLQAQNLLTFTGYKGGDPEIPAGENPGLAPLRTITMGIQLTF
jgi:hypothetical protein